MQALLVKPHMQSLSRALPTSFTAMINLTKLKLSGIAKGYKPHQQQSSLLNSQSEVNILGWLVHEGNRRVSNLRWARP